MRYARTPWHSRKKRPRAAEDSAGLVARLSVLGADHDCIGGDLWKGDGEGEPSGVRGKAECDLPKRSLVKTICYHNYLKAIMNKSELNSY